MFDRLINNYKQYGGMVFCFRMVKRLLSPVFHVESYILACNKLESVVTVEKNDILKEYHVSVLKNRDIPDLPLEEQKKKLFRKRLSDGGQQCLVAKKGNEVAYYGWIGTKHILIEAIGVELPLSENEGFLFDAYCFPRFRGQRLHSFITSHRLKTLQDLNRSKIWVSFIGDNKIARKVMESFGFVCKKKYQQIKIGFKQISRIVEIN